MWAVSLQTFYLDLCLVDKSCEDGILLQRWVQILALKAGRSSVYSPPAPPLRLRLCEDVYFFNEARRSLGHRERCDRKLTKSKPGAEMEFIDEETGVRNLFKLF